MLTKQRERERQRAREQERETQTQIETRQQTSCCRKHSETSNTVSKYFSSISIELLSTFSKFKL